MHFLEECCKAEDEDKVGQAKTGPPKAKVAAATIPPTMEDELAKQLKYQQHQIDTLVGQVKNLVSAVKATRASSRGAMTGGPGIHLHNTWRGCSRGRGLPTQTHPRITPQPRVRKPQLNQGVGHTFRCWQCGEVGHYRCECPTLKEKRTVQTGECLNSPKGLERQSPSEQSILDSTIEKGAEKLVDKKNSYKDPWTRLIGRANEEQIVINGHPVTALLDTGSQVTHVSKAFCQAKGLQINPLNQLVEIEGTGGGQYKICRLY